MHFQRLNRNHIKLIACVSMLLDHIGFLLLPEVAALRWAGRLAMPLFAFFIGEGCRYTRSRKKYFLSVFILGLACQLAYAADTLIETGDLGLTSDAWYLNILLAFSVSIPLCYAAADLKAALREKDAKKTKRAALLLAAGLSLFAAAAVTLRFLQSRGAGLHLDYGVWAVLLPLSTIPFDRPLPKLAAFTGTTLAFCIFTASLMPYIWFSLLAPAVLLLYNGEGGSRKYKYAFYVFYPAHLAALYLISLFI